MVKKDDNGEVKPVTKKKTTNKTQEEKTTKTATKKSSEKKTVKKTATSKTETATSKSKKVRTPKEDIKKEKVTKAEPKKEEVVMPILEGTSQEKTKEEAETTLEKAIETELPEPEKKKAKATFRTTEVVALVLITCFISLTMGSLITHSLLRDENKYDSTKFSDEMREFIDNYHYIMENYDGTITEKQLLNGAINGMLDVLDDPYAEFIGQDTRLDQELAGSYDGLGIEIVNNSDGNIEVYNVFESTPADRAGLQIGDIITSVNSLNLEGKNSSVFSIYVGDGEVGTTYEIGVRRGEETFTLSLTKEHIIIPSVFKEVFTSGDKKIGYLQVTIFSATTYHQFATMLEELEEEKIDGLIIDVRGNSGGRLDAVANMMSLFLDSSHIIYQTDTKGDIEKFYSKGSETKTYPITVLVDVNSASASEILAATLKEEYGATIVGKTTYGKGTVQEVKTLQNGDEYKLTTKKWLTPKGNWIDGTGVVPDIDADLNNEYFENPSNETDNQLQTALETF